jgi:hypothetical protein
MLQFSPTQAGSFCIIKNGWKTHLHLTITGNARLSIDGDVGTRWDTAGSQTPGQWYMVDFGHSRILIQSL